ncbi:hypothetical protein OG21DRAFT_789329 [Imleria badia]|nr:hypothetical protein OG21DRAFT_789329 [Imleria badia]
MLVALCVVCLVPLSSFPSTHGNNRSKGLTELAIARLRYADTIVFRPTSLSLSRLLEVEGATGSFVNTHASTLPISSHASPSGQFEALCNTAHNLVEWDSSGSPCFDSRNRRTILINESSTCVIQRKVGSDRFSRRP